MSFWQVFSHHSESNQGHSDFWCYSTVRCSANWAMVSQGCDASILNVLVHICTTSLIFSCILAGSRGKTGKHGSQTSSSASTVCSWRIVMSWTGHLLDIGQKVVKCCGLMLSKPPPWADVQYWNCSMVLNADDWASSLEGNTLHFKSPDPGLDPGLSPTHNLCLFFSPLAVWKKE